MPALVAPALPAGALARHEQPTLSAGALALRPWRPDDAPAVRAAFADPAIQRWHLRRMDSAEEAQAWVERWAAAWRASTDAAWAVVRTDDDRPVGYAALRDLHTFEATAQLSYWVLPAARGAGVALTAARTVARWAFEVLGLHRLSLVHSVANVPSCRVATRAGFALEGTLRGYLRHADGWHDVHAHARLATDEAG